jgi:hypothetical protein
MGHPDPDPVGVKDQHVLVVQAAPAGQHLLDPELQAAGGLGGRGRVSSASTIAPFAAGYRDEEYAGWDTREPGPPG